MPPASPRCARILSRRAAVAAAIEKFGRIDVLVNNAGFGLLAAVEESSDADVRRMYDTNVFGPLNVTRAVLPVMRKQRSGHVINLSSIGGYRSSAGFGVYCSTKLAVEGITEALHAELKPLGIHATVVEPGYFRTDFLDKSSLSVSPPRIEGYEDTVGAMRSAAARLNHGQPGDPDRLALVLVEFADAPRESERVVAPKLILPSAVRPGLLAARDTLRVAAVGQLPSKKERRPVVVERTPQRCGRRRYFR